MNTPPRAVITVCDNKMLSTRLQQSSNAIGMILDADFILAGYRLSFAAVEAGGPLCGDS
jgi:hypothetical protein